MPEPHEQLVKEYLEMKGYATLLDTKLEDGGDVDVIALRAGEPSEILVVQVKAQTWSSEKDLDEIKALFDLSVHEPLAAKLNELGIATPKFVLFCWPMAQKLTAKAKQRAQARGFELRTFDEIVKEMLQFLKQHMEDQGFIYWRDSPNLMLLQLVGSCLKDEHLRVDDFLPVSKKAKVRP